MSFNLANLASDLVTVVTKVETAVTDAKQIYTYASKVVTAAEAAYEGQVNAGATKKASVMAATAAFATSLGANWSLLESAVSAWIDVLIAAYNAAADVIGTPQVNQAAVDTAVAAGESVSTPVVETASEVAQAVVPETTPSPTAGL
jgi:hypothetical protein